MAQYDIYSNSRYKWTQATTDEIKEAGVPFVTMKEYENQTDLIFQNLMFLRKSRINTAKGIVNSSFSDLYKGTYQIMPTGNEYTLPYLGKQPMHMETAYKQIDIDADSNSWGLTIEQIRKKAGNWRPEIKSDYEAILKALNLNQSGSDMSNNFRGEWQRITTEGGRNFAIGASLSQQSPKVYDSSNTGQFSTTFTLINEGDDGSSVLANNHYKFIMRMMLSLAPSYPDPMRVHVPYVYDVNIPSLTHLPLAFISSFDAAPVGSAKMVGGLYVPEGWKITIAFNSLFPISRQLISTMAGEDAAETTKKAFALESEVSDDDNDIAYSEKRLEPAADATLSQIVSAYKATGE